MPTLPAVMQWHRALPRELEVADATKHSLAQMVGDMALLNIPAEQDLISTEVAMPTPGLQDSEDDYVTISGPHQVQFISLDDGVAVSKDALAEPHATWASLTQDESSETKPDQRIVAEEWTAAAASMLDAQKALMAAEKSYKKLQHAFADGTDHIKDT